MKTKGLPIAQWRKVKQAPFYDVHETGLIRSVKHKHIIHPKETENGPYVNLMVKDKFVDFHLPHIVLSNFSKQYTEGDPISYRDGNRFNCSRRNLCFRMVAKRNLPDVDEKDVKLWKCEVKSQSANRRGKNIGIIDRYDVYMALMRSEKRCFYCNILLEHSTWELDHYAPIYSGGQNTPINIVAACNPCNRLKGTMHYEQMISHILRIMSVHLSLDFRNENSYLTNNSEKIKNLIASEKELDLFKGLL